MKILARGAAALVAVAAAVACGDVHADLAPAIAEPVVATDAGPASGRAVQEALPLECPLAPPGAVVGPDGGVVDAGGEAGTFVSFSGCSLLGVCEYGTSADRECNGVFTCDGREWALARSGGCHEDACPKVRRTMVELEGTPCELRGDDAAEAVCDVADGTCACTTGAGGRDVHERRWVCSAPLTRDCPLLRPLIGSACGAPLYCDYGTCKTKRGFAVECHRGAWRAVGNLCEL